MKDLEKQLDERIEEIVKIGINANNIDNLMKLTKIKHFVKEEDKMYNGYGRYGENYGYRGYDGYGRRGYDAKYRGYDHLERMGDNYGRYMDSHERYGASPEANDSLKSMLECMKSFAKVIKEEVKSPEEEQIFRKAIQEMM